jgi:hypothetical protein
MLDVTRICMLGAEETGDAGTGLDGSGDTTWMESSD